MSKVEFSYFTLLIVAFLNDALSFRRVSLCNYIAFTFANKKMISDQILLIKVKL